MYLLNRVLLKIDTRKPIDQNSAESKKLVFNKTSVLLILVLFCYCFATAQETKLDSIYYKSDFDIMDRIIFSDNTITSQFYQNYEVEKPYWEDGKTIIVKDKSLEGNKHYLLIENSKGLKSGVIFTIYPNGLVIFHGLREEITSMKTLKLKTNTNLPTILYFNEKFENNRKNLKPLSELSKEDLITAITFVQRHDSQLVDYLTKNNLKQYQVFRLAENLYNFKLYDLGYDPYNLPDEGNYMDKFKNDQEVKNLFKAQQIFKMKID